MTPALRPVALACGDYDLTRPLMDGRVDVEGCTLTPVTLNPGELFWRMFRHGEFDVAEVSLSAYLVGRSRGDDRFVGIPVFPFRAFRHGYVFVREGAGIDRPEDLRGRRVGVPEYHMTAALYIRGLLHDEYGIRPEELRWFQGGQDNPGRKERVDVEVPQGVELTRIPEDRTLREMLLAGELDALATSRIPPELGAGGGVRRLLRDPRAAAAASWHRTGVFPIMHLVALRREVYEAAPWMAQSLVKAFEAAKAMALQGLEAHAPASPLPFFRDELERTWSEFGGASLWAYGAEANRPTLEAALRYSHEQGLSERRLAVDELFAPETLAPYHASEPAQGKAW